MQICVCEEQTSDSNFHPFCIFINEEELRLEPFHQNGRSRQTLYNNSLIGNTKLYFALSLVKLYILVIKTLMILKNRESYMDDTIFSTQFSIPLYYFYQILRYHSVRNNCY